MNLTLALILTAFVLCAAVSAQKHPDAWDVRDYGAKGDGKTDDTPAFQKALDAAGRAGGGTVHAPRGNYFFAGHLNVPNAVTLEGVWKSVPAHNGIRDPGLPKPTDDGTTFLITEGAGKEGGPPFSPSTPTARSRALFSTTPGRKRTTRRNPIPTPSPCAARTRRYWMSRCSIPTMGSTQRRTSGI